MGVVAVTSKAATAAAVLQKCMHRSLGEVAVLHFCSSAGL